MPSGTPKIIFDKQLYVMTDLYICIMISPSLSIATHKRIEELDFLKSIFILLMVAFHLLYFADHYPLLKQWVYTFHMPGFLLISGYLMPVNKGGRHIARTLWWFTVPYLFLESAYIVLSTVVPVHDPIKDLTILVFVEKIFFNPVGPYWYLHTLILCGAFYFVVFRWLKGPALSRIFALGLAYFSLAYVGLVAWDMSLYFAIGLIVRQSGLTFLQVFRPSWWALPVLGLLACRPDTFYKGTLGGMLTVYAVIATALALYPRLPRVIKRLFLFLGRNSLVIFLFSPLFVKVCKILLPRYLAFDSTHLLFLFIALPLCVIGSLAVCKVLDLLHLTPWFLGRPSALA
ncbi:acyltransferase [Alloprevotella tannerae]|nr:acyltransferase [Alloprevotella tannerae]